MAAESVWTGSGSTWSGGGGSSSGGVTSVTGTSPIVSSGGATPSISILNQTRAQKITARALAALASGSIVESFWDFSKPSDQTGITFVGGSVPDANIPGGAFKLTTTTLSTTSQQAYGPKTACLGRTDTGVGYAEFGLKLTTATIHASMTLYASLVSNNDNSECLAVGVFGAHSTTQFAVKNGAAYIDLGAVDTALHSFGLAYVGDGNFQPYFDGVAVGAPVAFQNGKTFSATPLYHLSSSDQSNGADASVAAIWVDYIYNATNPST